MADQEADQSSEDNIYNHLPDILAAAKTSRVPADEFVPFCCRFCGYKFNRRGALEIHLGRYKRWGKFSLVCKTAKVRIDSMDMGS